MRNQYRNLRSLHTLLAELTPVPPVRRTPELCLAIFDIVDCGLIRELVISYSYLNVERGVNNAEHLSEDKRQRSPFRA